MDEALNYYQGEAEYPAFLSPNCLASDCWSESGDKGSGSRCDYFGSGRRHGRRGLAELKEVAGQGWCRVVAGPRSFWFNLQHADGNFEQLPAPSML